VTWLHLPSLPCSLGLAADSSPPVSSDTVSSATSIANPTASKCSGPGSETATSTTPPSGTTSAPSTADRGVGWWMSSLRASRARTFHQQGRVIGRGSKVSVAGYGSRLRELLEKCGLKPSFWKTPRTYGPTDSLLSSVNLPTWGLTVDGECWGLGMGAPRTGETVFGLWPTPTTRSNEHSPSILKWPARRRMFATLAACLYGNNQGGGQGRTGKVRQSFEREIGGLSLSLREWMMGWPIGWTALEPLETARFQQWLSLHGGY
jgi:hypothetical protein